MTIGLFFTLLLALSVVGFIVGRQRAAATAGGDITTLHSRQTYHGMSVGLVTLLAGLSAWLIWMALSAVAPGLNNPWLRGLISLAAGLAAFALAFGKIDREFPRPQLRRAHGSRHPDAGLVDRDPHDPRHRHVAAV